MTAIRTLGDISRATQPGFEGEIREFIHRDFSFRQKPAAADGADKSADSTSAVVERICGSALQDIDRVILELHGMRDVLRHEGDRVRDALSEFTALSRTAMASMRIISESVARWKPEALRIGHENG
jgi:hypothetical protein